MVLGWWADKFWLVFRLNYAYDEVVKMLPLYYYGINYLSLCDAPPMAQIAGKLLYHVICEFRILEENASIGKKIRFFRTKRYPNSHMLAEAVGLSRYAILDYENGVSEPSLEDLNKISVALKIEADKLYDDYYKFLNYPYYVKIKEIRTEHNLLQRELGEMLEVGRRAVERWEHGKNIVSREKWEQLSLLGFL